MTSSRKSGEVLFLRIPVFSESFMLQELLPPAPLYGHAARRHLARTSGNEAIEGLFLQSLREGASDFQERENPEVWSALEQQCRSDLNMDEDTFRFLLKGGVKYRQIRKDALKVAKNWKSRLKRAPKFSWRPRIVLLLPEGQAIRTFLLTDVCKKLARWTDLFILSPHDIEAEVTALGPHARFLPIPSLRRSHFDYLVGYLGYLQTESSTSRRFAERLNENMLKALKDGQPMSTTLRIWQIATAYPSDDYLLLYCWSLKLFAHNYFLKEAMSLLKALDADLIFNTSVVNWSSRLWTRAAALNGLPIVSNIISWDNMSTKTLIDEFVDKFLIWSDEMDEDFTTSLPFVRHKPRVIVGTPQFEPIVQGKGLVSRQEFLGRYGLDPNKQLILYTTGSKTLFPREADCLDHLLSHWRGNLSDRANVMVRMHPKDRQGRYGDVMAKFPEVPFTVAGQALTDQDEWVPAWGDITLLVNQLHHCDVIINVASTMTLEGFAIDKPSINIGFSLGLSVSARYPMDDYYKSRHYRDIVDTGAARLVENLDQLYKAIDDVLDRKLYDVRKQRRVLRKKCRYTEDSSSRIDRALRRHAYLNTGWVWRRLDWLASRGPFKSSTAKAAS